MKKTWIPILLISGLLFPLSTLSTAEAENSWSFITFTVNTPAENKTYHTNQLPLNVSVQWHCANLYKVSYSLDGQNRHYMPVNLNLGDPRVSLGGCYSGLDTLPKLSDGDHSVTVYIEGQWGYSTAHRIQETTVFFTVDNKPPIISNISIQNQTHNQPEVLLNFTVNDQTSWMGYSLDNTANVTISGNTTLTPPVGSHSLVIYANDTAGNSAKSDLLFFAISEPEPKLNLLLLTTLVTTFLIICAISILLFRYKKKYSTLKHNSTFLLIF
jgi:hypothetical protein